MKMDWWSLVAVLAFVATFVVPLVVWDRMNDE